MFLRLLIYILMLVLLFYLCPSSVRVVGGGKGRHVLRGYEDADM